MSSQPSTLGFQLFPVITADDWRRSIVAQRARPNAALQQIRLAVVRLHFLRLLIRDIRG